MSDHRSLSADLELEIEAINAIYGSGTLTRLAQASSSSSSPDAEHTELLLTPPPEHPLSPITLILAFPPAYPSSASGPPSVLGTHSVGTSLPKGAGQSAVAVARDVLARVFNEGEVCVYELLTELDGVLSEASAKTSAPNDNDDKDGELAIGLEGSRWGNGGSSVLQQGQQQQQGPLSITAGAAAAPAFEPRWIASDPLTEKKSLFVAHACAVSSPADLAAATAALFAADKRIARATHNIRAWRLKSSVPATHNNNTGNSTTTGKGGGGGGGGLTKADVREITHQDRDSDGETAAGGRVLGLMQTMDVWGVLVVVSRWYGGVKLGPDRFRIIGALAREVLVKGGWAEAGRKGK